MFENDSDHIFSVTDPAVALEDFSQCLNVPADRCGPYKSTESEPDPVLGSPHSSLKPSTAETKPGPALLHFS